MSKREEQPTWYVGAPARNRSRFFLLIVLGGLTAWYSTLAARLFYIQIVEHERYATLGRNTRRGTDRIPATRGDVLTHDRVIIARSLRSSEIGLDPSLLEPDPSRPGRDPLVDAVQCVSDALAYPAEVRRSHLDRALRQRKRGGEYVRLARHVEEADVNRIRTALAERLSVDEMKAFCRVSSSHRVYPHGALFSQLLGVTDAGGRGLEGLELSMDAYLAERDGRRRVIKGALQRARIYFPEESDIPPIDGYDVVLTLDSWLQKILVDELRDGIEIHKAAAGVGLVMECHSGAILAMASLPDYDPTRYHAYPPEECAERRKDRPIENVYEPGSVMKPFIASMALSLGLTRRDEPIWKGGASHRLTHGRAGRTVRDVRDHGALNMEDVVVHSSNIGMSILGLRLGRDRLIDTLDRFGFARPTGIKLPGEAPGMKRPRSEWRELYTSVSVSFGYAVMVTPLQLCTAFAALINGGQLYRPRLVERLVRGEEEIAFPAEVVGQAIDPETSRTMREILLRVVQEGTGKYLQMEGFQFGGKSGTADMDPLYTKKDYLASFMAFAPYENPEIVVLVMIEKPRGRSYYGSTVAGSVVAAVLRRYYRIEDEAYMNVVNRRRRQ